MSITWTDILQFFAAFLLFYGVLAAVATVLSMRILRRFIDETTLSIVMPLLWLIWFVVLVISFFSFSE
ncbi:MAG: hypothetical protein O3A00_06495 [Planctomycetota bacterium]|nr:hypothetical protein [Planctomycetota bacterium]